MSICRVEKNSNYTVMSNYHLRDDNLTLKAKGLLSLVLSLPDNWDYTVNGLVSICKENRTAINSALEELKNNGYLVVIKKLPSQTDSGRFEYEYNFFESPKKQDGKKQGTENLYVENQHIEKPQQLNKDKVNKDKVNKDLKNEKKSKTKKDRYLDKVLGKFAEYEFSEKVMDKILDFYSDRIDKGDYPAENQLTLTLDTLAGVDEHSQLEAINNSIRNGYKGIFINTQKSSKQSYRLDNTDKESIEDHNSRVDSMMNNPRFIF
jgi:hypothetical protein